MIIAVFKPSQQLPPTLYQKIKQLNPIISFGMDLMPNNCAMTDGFTRHCICDGGDDSVIEPTTFYFDSSTNVTAIDFTNDSKWLHMGNSISINVLVSNKLCTIIIFPNGTSQTLLSQISSIL